MRLVWFGVVSGTNSRLHLTAGLGMRKASCQSFVLLVNGQGWPFGRPFSFWINRLCCSSHETKNEIQPISKRKMRYNLYRQMFLKPGFCREQPLSGSFSVLCFFTGAVLLTDAFKWHTTPVGTPPSPDIVRCVVGLAFVLLEIRFAAAVYCIVCAVATYSPSSRAASLGISHRY